VRYLFIDIVERTEILTGNAGTTFDTISPPLILKIPACFSQNNSTILMNSSCNKEKRNGNLAAGV
jgi:hypothetical protein